MREDLEIENGLVPRVMREPSGLRRGLTWLSDLAFPPLCLSCRSGLAAHDALCATCWSRIDFIRAPLCDKLGLPLPYDTGGTMISAAAAADPPSYDRARAVAHYSGAMRELAQKFKFSDGLAARNLLSRLMCEAGAELIRDAEIVVPIPLSWRRLVSRRFNQSALLAQDLAAFGGIAYDPMVLRRTRATPPQVGLTRGERKLNVRGAFSVPASKSGKIAGRRVLLIDDVITTGATCGSAARALKRAGAAQVDVLALALVTDLSAIAD